MDTIGLMVYAADEKGFLRVTPLGGVNAAQMAARKVVFENGAEGVVYSEPLPDGKYTMGRLFIDVGAETEEEALKIAPVGSVCSLPLQAAFLGERVSAPYMDNRSACAVLVELVQSLGKTKHDVFAVFSTQEEVGCRGAKAAAFALEPDVGIAIDVTVAGGTPKADPPMPVYVGKGPAAASPPPLCATRSSPPPDARAFPSNTKCCPTAARTLPPLSPRAAAFPPARFRSPVSTSTPPLKPSACAIWSNPSRC